MGNIKLTLDPLSGQLGINNLDNEQVVENLDISIGCRTQNQKDGSIDYIFYCSKALFDMDSINAESDMQYYTVSVSKSELSDDEGTQVALLQLGLNAPPVAENFSSFTHAVISADVTIFQLSVDIDVYEVWMLPNTFVKEYSQKPNSDYNNTVFTLDIFGGIKREFTTQPEYYENVLGTDSDIVAEMWEHGITYTKFVLTCGTVDETYDSVPYTFIGFSNGELTNSNPIGQVWNRSKIQDALFCGHQPLAICFGIDKNTGDVKLFSEQTIRAEHIEGAHKQFTYEYRAKVRFNVTGDEYELDGVDPTIGGLFSDKSMLEFEVPLALSDRIKESVDKVDEITVLIAAVKK